jgi:hypothetical protein
LVTETAGKGLEVTANSENPVKMKREFSTREAMYV